MSQSVVIGLVGLPGAGKTTVSKYLESKGFTHITLSDFIREEALKSGTKTITREVLQDTGNAMRQTFGPQILAQLAHKKIASENLQQVVIDGIRNLYEIAYLGVENNFTLLGVTAPPKARFSRLVERVDKKRFSGKFEDFLAEEKREESLGSRETGLRVSECLKKARFTIKNNGDIGDLERKTDEILLKIKGYQPREKKNSNGKAHANVTRIVILGSPGAGKTTQGRLLSGYLQIPCLSMGEILRDAYKKGDPEGIEWWEKYGRKGLNAPIHLKFPLLVKRLVNAEKGFILDDFPRTGEDLEALTSFLRLSQAKLTKVILLDVSEQTAVRRMLKRFMASAKRGIARYDDSPYLLKIRIKEGYKKELPIIRGYFEKLNLLSDIDGNGGKSIRDVHNEIVNALFGNS